jgi:hypothetical protein
MIVMRRLVTIVMLVALASPTSAAARRGPHRRECRVPKGARVLVADGKAQVYAYDENAPLSVALEVFGCTYGGQRTVLLGGQQLSGGSAGLALETVSGYYVAYEELTAVNGDRHEGYVTMLVVRDLRSGHVARRVPSGAATRPAVGAQGTGPITGIVLRANGTAAWIAQTESHEEGGLPARYAYAVEDAPTSGPVTSLASGETVNPHSLALAGGTLYWLQAGKPMSADLP